MKKDDILILCQFFYPEFISSATLPTEMAVDLVKNGFKVNVLCGYPIEYVENGTSNIPLKENFNGINIIRIKYAKIDRSSSFKRLWSFFSFVIGVVLHLPYILKHKCIITYSNPPVLPIIPAVISKIFGIKVIFVAYDIYPDIAIAMNIVKKNGLMPGIMNLINKMVYKRSSKVIALSSEMKDYILNKKLIKDSSKIEVIPNWFDREKIDFGKISSKKIGALKHKKRFIVLYTGNMGTCQDMETILQCMYKLKDNDKIQFIFTGHGNKVPYIKKFIIDNSLNNVIFYDFLIGKEFSDILQIADCNIVSLEKGMEGLSVPSKTYSYLAAGKALIAIMSNDTDIAKILKDFDAGYCINQNDADGLKTIILKLSANQVLCWNKGKNARFAFEKLYERKVCTDKYCNLLKEII